MTTHLHLFDLPDGIAFDGDIAVDTEAMGLNNHRDRLCVVQLSDGKGDQHVVHFPEPKYDAPNLKKVLSDTSRVKLFHFARFDVAILLLYLGVETVPLYCTKIASKLARTYTDRHGLRDLCRELLGVEISKQQQSSNWGAKELSPEQIDYAASDVLYLHQMREKLDEMLEREGRKDVAYECFDFVPVRAELDLRGWDETDIFAHA